MRLKGAEAAQHIGDIVCLLTGIIEGGVIEQVGRPDEHAFCELEAGGDDAWWAIEADRITLADGYGHKRAVV